MFGSGALAMGAAPRVALGACVVPALAGKRPAKARTAIRKARCAVGRVRQVRQRRRAGRVVSQSPKQGTRLAARGRVNFAVAR
jgi:beta-lactam-binding protein with PASTA domain